MANQAAKIFNMAHATKVTDAEVEQRLSAIEYARGSVAHLAPDQNLADELIADRRAEAKEQAGTGAGQHSGKR